MKNNPKPLKNIVIDKIGESITKAGNKDDKIGELPLPPSLIEDISIRKGVRDVFLKYSSLHPEFFIKSHKGNEIFPKECEYTIKLSPLHYKEAIERVSFGRERDFQIYVYIHLPSAEADQKKGYFEKIFKSKPKAENDFQIVVSDARMSNFEELLKKDGRSLPDDVIEKIVKKIKKLKQTELEVVDEMRGGGSYQDIIKRGELQSLRDRENRMRMEQARQMKSVFDSSCRVM